MLQKTDGGKRIWTTEYIIKYKWGIAGASLCGNSCVANTVMLFCPCQLIAAWTLCLRASRLRFSKWRKSWMKWESTISGLHSAMQQDRLSAMISVFAQGSYQQHKDIDAQGWLWILFGRFFQCAENPRKIQIPQPDSFDERCGYSEQCYWEIYLLSHQSQP